MYAKGRGIEFTRVCMLKVGRIGFTRVCMLKVRGIGFIRVCMLGRGKGGVDN